MWMMPGDWGWGWFAMGWVWMLLFWGAIIWLVVWGVSRATGGRGNAGNSALDIAKARYARGEIAKEEFERLKKDLA